MELVLSASTEQLIEKFRSLQTAKNVANLLEIDSNTLNYHLRKVSDPACYTTFEIPKKSGGMRLISAPSTTLKIIQRKLNNVLQLIYEPRRSSHGFVLERSIVTNARKHCNRRLLFNMDLKDFFPSINFGRVRGLFMSIPYELNPIIATILARICCFNNVLPQGAPTSPIISNMICWKLDKKLEILARQHRCAYTRYADDITFSTSKWYFDKEIIQVRSSGDIEVGSVLSTIIKDNGFSVNPEKIRLRNKSQRQEVTGLTTNVFPNVQRRYVRNIRAMIHAWNKYGLNAANEEYWKSHDMKYRNSHKHVPSFEQIVKGKIDYLGMVRGKDNHIYIKFLTQLEKLRIKSIWETLKPEPGLETVPVPAPVTTLEPTLEPMPEPKKAADRDTSKLLINFMRHISPTSSSPSVPVSTRENLDEPLVTVHRINDTEDIDSVRVCLVQIDYSVTLQKPPMEFGYVLADNNREIVKQKVFSALDVARNERAHIICFPELSIDKDWLDQIQVGFKDIIIIAGSYYRDGFNICPVLISGECYPVKKINPSPLLEGSVAFGRGMKHGDEIHVFQTKSGSFMVLICIDYIKEYRRFYDNQANSQINIDMVINPSFNREVVDFQNTANLDCKYSSHYPYILQTNVIKLVDKTHDGTCIIGMEHTAALTRYEGEGFRKEGDPIEYKLLEAIKDKECMIFANLDIKRKGEFIPGRRLKMQGVCQYGFENDKWQRLE